MCTEVLDVQIKVFSKTRIRFNYVLYSSFCSNISYFPLFSRLQKQMKIMNKNLNSKLEELHGFQAIDTNVALTEIRSQLHELTKSVESCQSEVYEVKQDMMTVKSEIDSVQFVKDEIDDIRDSLDRLEADGERRKAKLSDQVYSLSYLLIIRSSNLIV